MTCSSWVCPITEPPVHCTGRCIDPFDTHHQIPTIHFNADDFTICNFASLFVLLVTFDRSAKKRATAAGAKKCAKRATPNKDITIKRWTRHELQIEYILYMHVVHTLTNYSMYINVNYIYILYTYIQYTNCTILLSYTYIRIYVYICRYAYVYIGTLVFV